MHKLSFKKEGVALVREWYYKHVFLGNLQKYLNSFFPSAPFTVN